jgi:hypothetical protein
VLLMASAVGSGILSFDVSDDDVGIILVSFLSTLKETLLLFPLLIIGEKNDDGVAMEFKSAVIGFTGEFLTSAEGEGSDDEEESAGCPGPGCLTLLLEMEISTSG